jgi:glycosyltransferase involved in cell wall biosynthesis
MTLIYLSDTIPWFGNYTGYQWLPRYFTNHALQECRVTHTRGGLSERVRGKLAQKLCGFANPNSLRAASELRFSARTATTPGAIGHVLYLEDHLPMWRKTDRWRRRIGTAHLPPSCWTGEMKSLLANVEHLILLYERDVQFFADIVGKGRVHFLRNGVDTDFFEPASTNDHGSDERRILFAGHWLRNTEMLARVVPRLLDAVPKLSFDFLVPSQWRKATGLRSLRALGRIRWHENLTDHQLRALYQSSYLLLIPLSDGGANTALTEALACGLPVVTTNRGGTSSYGAGSIYPVVENNDDQAMIDLVLTYLNQNSWRNEIAQKCRRFAEEKLAWKACAKAHAALYVRIFGN